MQDFVVGVRMARLGIYEFVVGSAVGFALAGGAVIPDPKLVELIDDRSDEFGIVSKDAGFEIAAVFAFGSEAGSG